MSVAGGAGAALGLEIDSATSYSSPEEIDFISESRDGSRGINEKFGELGATLKKLFKALFDGLKFVLKCARPSAKEAHIVLLGVDRSAEGTTLQILGSEASTAFKLAKASRCERVVHGATI